MDLPLSRHDENVDHTDPNFEFEAPHFHDFHCEQDDGADAWFGQL